MESIAQEDLVMEIDVRCPVQGSPRELLFRVEADDEEDLEDAASMGILLCITCSWCGRSARKVDTSIRRVVHKFSVDGKHVETIRE